MIDEENEELKEYKRIYEDCDLDYIEPPSFNLAIQWLESKIDAIIKIKKIYNDNNFPLTWGEFNDSEGEYEYSIETCGFGLFSPVELHIYEGIGLLAELIGVELNKNEREMWFTYQGYKVFQLIK